MSVLQFTGSVVEMSRTYNERTDQYVVEIVLEDETGAHVGFDVSESTAAQVKFGQDLQVTITSVEEDAE
jgi:uncharacterized OB-fold protein